MHWDILKSRIHLTMYGSRSGAYFHNVSVSSTPLWRFIAAGKTRTTRQRPSGPDIGDTFKTLLGRIDFFAAHSRTGKPISAPPAMPTQLEYALDFRNTGRNFTRLAGGILKEYYGDNQIL